jgi:hypothetical protein
LKGNGMSEIEILGLGGVAVLAIFLMIRAFLGRGGSSDPEASADTGTASFASEGGDGGD